jgi:mannose-6-phosphate isomerase
MDVTVDSELDRVDWVQAKADLTADDFDNGRSPSALERSFAVASFVALAWGCERLVGMARMLSDGVCNAYLLDVWTASSHRRRGIGSAMVGYLLDRVPGQHVGLQTDEAGAFYERLGFRPQREFYSAVVGRWLDNDANRRSGAVDGSRGEHRTRPVVRATMELVGIERVERPWGSFTVLEDAPGHKVKRIEVRPGSRLSYQRHERRAEHWFVVAGTAEAVLDGRSVRLGPGDAVDVPKGAPHRVANTGGDPLVFVEVQVGEYFGEDDIERLDDDYGRAGSTG